MRGTRSVDDVFNEASLLTIDLAQYPNRSKRAGLHTLLHSVLPAFRQFPLTCHVEAISERKPVIDGGNGKPLNFSVEDFNKSFLSSSSSLDIQNRWA